MRSFKLIVFDWDGTLMNSEGRIVASAAAAMADLGLPVLPQERIRNIIGLGLREAAQTLLPGRSDSFYGEYIERYRFHFLERNRTPMPLFQGVRETLHDLRAGGWLMAVATGKSRRGLDRSLEETGLSAFFAASRCADEAPSKPHPAMLVELMTELGMTPSETLMVGDTEYDMQMARNAGTSAIAVSYGVHERNRLLEFAPLACVDAITEVKDWLGLR